MWNFHKAMFEWQLLRRRRRRRPSAVIKHGGKILEVLLRDPPVMCYQWTLAQRVHSSPQNHLLYKIIKWAKSLCSSFKMEKLRLIHKQVVSSVCFPIERGSTAHPSCLAPEEKFPILWSSMTWRIWCTHMTLWNPPMDGCEILQHQFGMVESREIMGCWPSINWWFGFRHHPQDERR